MRKFDYNELSKKLWDNEILSFIAKINECKGRQELFMRQKPVQLDRLVEVAKIQSTEASNKIEGIVTTSARIKQLMNEKTMPKSRSEQEIVGYRDVLNTIHENYDFIPLSSNYILQLHRDLLKHTDLSYGGNFKTTENIIGETSADGTVVTRFTPLSSFETPEAIRQICESYQYVLAIEKVEPLILIPAFILDFLCIHPFNDAQAAPSGDLNNFHKCKRGVYDPYGNGRMARLLTLLLLYQNGYEVGKYISIEKQIEKTKDVYYEVLQASGIGWHEGENDSTPFIKYMLQIILYCYRDFEERVGALEASGVKSSSYDVVKNYVMRTLGRFTSNDAIENCPSIGRSSVVAALSKLVDEGTVTRLGVGKSTRYFRTN